MVVLHEIQCCDKFIIVNGNLRYDMYTLSQIYFSIFRNHIARLYHERLDAYVMGLGPWFSALMSQVEKIDYMVPLAYMFLVFHIRQMEHMRKVQIHSRVHMAGFEEMV